MFLSMLMNKRALIGWNKKPVFEGDRSSLARWVISVLTILLLIAMVASLSIGPAGVTFVDFISYMKAIFTENEVSDRNRLIIETIRMPRLIMGILIGAALAVCGAVMQGLFRNPLADPGIVGVSSGAGLGAVSMIVLGGTLFAPLTDILGVFTLPVAAFLGALIVTLVLYRLSTSNGETSIAMLLLGGIAIAALAAALTGILIYLADDQQLRDLTFWGLGSLAGATWIKSISIGPIIILCLICTPFLAKGLNALALGEAAAHHVGIPIQKFKTMAIVMVAAATGAAVAVSGGIGFVGIIAPHTLRLLMGPDNKYLLPASALLGATFLTICDVICRTIAAPSELPIGIITALIGAPFFLWILMSRRGFVGE